MEGSRGEEVCHDRGGIESLGRNGKFAGEIGGGKRGGRRVWGRRIGEEVAA